MLASAISVGFRGPHPKFFEHRKLDIREYQYIHAISVGRAIIYINLDLRGIMRNLRTIKLALLLLNSRLWRAKLWPRGYQSDFYVNIYEVDRCYGGSEEGGWWWTSYIPFEELPRYSWGCDTIEEARIVKEWLTGTLTDYQPSRNRYSVVGGPDIEAIIEEHTPMVQPTSRPHYC